MLFHQKSQRIWGVYLLVALLGGCASCSKEEPVNPAPPESSERSPAPVADAPPPEPDPFDRLVFGLPIPPRATGLHDEGHRVRVKVAMNLREVGAFFEENFVDFEILYSRDAVHAVGLRDYMPRVHAYPYGHSSFVVYSRAKLKPEEVKKAAAEAKAQNIPTPREIASYKKGDPVLERAADGRLLAPGARWGEPYTPPPGSPLDTVHFRANFGLPYGEWVAR